MRILSPIAKIGLVALLALAGYVSCRNYPTKAKTAPPVGLDTVPVISGWYAGYEIIDDLKANTRVQLNVTMQIDSVNDSVSGCPRSYVINVYDDSSLLHTFSLGGTPPKMSWNCSSGGYRLLFTGNADGLQLSGLLEHFASNGSTEVLLKTTQIRGSKPR